MECCNIAALKTLPAQVAELVDAADSKSAAFTGVLVRFQSWARSFTKTPEIRYSKEFQELLN